MKISEIIDALWHYHKPLDPERRTCDQIQYGDTDKECTGVVVTCSPSADVIRQASEMGYNLVLGHEPLFYDGWDETDWLKNDRVLEAKKKLLNDTGIVVVRDHDHMHHDQPDVIFSGLARQLGWEQYQQTKHGPSLGYLYILPKTTVRAVAKHVSDVMNIHGIRILGDPDMSVERVLIAAHFLGTDWDRMGIRLIEETNAELIIPGEIIDWTLGAYIQDANALGMRKAVLNVGHYNLEEPGMKEFSTRLADILGPDIPIRFIQSGDSFRWLDKSK